MLNDETRKTLAAILEIISEHVTENHPDDTVLRQLTEAARRQVNPEHLHQRIDLEQLEHPRFRE